MNVVDYCILGVIGVSILFGIYRGFVASMLNTGGTLISFGLAYWLYPKFTAVIQSNPQWQRTLLSYTDAERRLGDLTLSAQNVATLTKNQIAEIVERAHLPGSLGEILRSNLENQIYTGIDSVKDYVSETIVEACINILCFLVAFGLLFLVITLVLSALRAVVKFPVLKQMDGLAGGVFGLLRGVVFVFALFTLMPILETVIPIQSVTELISQSRLAMLFNSGTLITSIMNGTLFS